MTDPTTDRSALREQLLNALDFSYCQGVGYATPEELLAAYDADRTPADQTAPRETAEAVLAAVETALGDTLVPSARAEALAGIAAVLPATTDQTADRADWDAMAERTGRLRKTTKELLDRAEELEARVAQLSVDRAAVLREAADIAEAQRQFEPAYGARKSAQVSENVGILRVAAELRRMADETQPAETEADLPARLEAALTERYTELGNPFSEMRRREQGPDGWPASHPVGPHHVAEVLRELLATGARQDGAQR
ncbi:hypothetical protein ACIQHU_26320 [Streptomyces tendae]|uniref:hypothetical protein n=1 Tax=Streptomyces tendae TaxID=1932 RepID=UPI0037F2666A